MTRISIWRELSKKEEQEYRQWAKTNYVPFSELNPLWHPVILDECIKMNENAMDPQTFMLNIIDRFSPIVNGTKEK
jgi:hypothetical protein